jgi:molecular chaperone GrpE
MEAKGQVFDSEFHEAIANVPMTDEKQKGKVIDDVEKGYLLGEKVIRYAKVVVGQ